MTTVADELRAAAFQLRNPFHGRGLKVGIDPDVGHALADLLDDQADGDDEGVINPWALAVARALNGDAR